VGTGSDWQAEHEHATEEGWHRHASAPTRAPRGEQGERGPTQVEQRRQDVASEREKEQRVDKLGVVSCIRMERVGPVQNVREASVLRELGRVRTVVPERVDVRHTSAQRDRYV
jgi:hypothetical protein